MMNNVTIAIEKTMSCQHTYCKLLSPNDSGETGGHQSGILISSSAKEMLFTKEDMSQHIAKRAVKIKWQDDFYTKGCFTWYESKKELRLTRYTRNFPYKGADYTGALFVLAKKDDNNYDAFILNSEDEINEYLSAFGLTPAETNRPINIQNVDSSIKEKIAIDNFISTLTVDFPSSEIMSAAARMITYQVLLNKSIAVDNPDKALLEWTAEEYKLFKTLEQVRYGDQISKGFSSVDQFVVLANQVLNRRKSRAGKSLEHHLAAIFNENGIRYTAQAVTEGNKKPDFLFPSQEAYHDTAFPTESITVLAAKTTCKDRWRQILNEANRLRDGKKFLCTLQQGISAAQMDEMESEGVILIVPKAYIGTYPKDRQDRIWTLARFVKYVKELETEQ